MHDTYNTENDLCRRGIVCSILEYPILEYSFEFLNKKKKIVSRSATKDSIIICGLCSFIIKLGIIHSSYVVDIP